MATKLLEEINEDFSQLSDILVALGDKKRQIILVYLIESHQKKTLCVQDISNLTGISRPAVSHHLKILKAAGVINYEKVGKQSYYHLDHVQYNISLVKQLTDHLIEVTCD